MTERDQIVIYLRSLAERIEVGGESPRVPSRASSRSACDPRRVQRIVRRTGRAQVDRWRLRVQMTTPFNTDDYAEPSEESLRVCARPVSEIVARADMEAARNAIAKAAHEAELDKAVEFIVGLNKAGNAPGEYAATFDKPMPTSDYKVTVKALLGMAPKLDTSEANRLPTDEDGDPITWGQFRADKPGTSVCIRLPIEEAYPGIAAWLPTEPEVPFAELDRRAWLASLKPGDRVKLCEGDVTLMDPAICGGSQVYYAERFVPGRTNMVPLMREDECAVRWESSDGCVTYMRCHESQLVEP